MDRKLYLEFEEIFKRMWNLQQEIKGVQTQQLSHSEKLSEINSSIDGHTENISSHSTTISQINTDLTKVGERIDTIETNQDILKSNINTISMCPNGIFLHKVITGINQNYSLIYTAEYNCIATIRGDYSNWAAYFIRSNGIDSFYQWANRQSSPLFLLAPGDSIYLEMVDGTINWADLYVLFTKGV